MQSGRHTGTTPDGREDVVSSSCILVCIPFQWNFRAARDLQTMTDSRAQGDQVDVVGTKNGRISFDDLGDDL